MKIFFNEKHKRKRYSIIMSSLSIIMLLYFSNVLGHNPFLNFKDLIFTILLVILGLSSATLAEIVENRNFFDIEDRQKRFIISEIVKALLLIICILIIYVIFQLIQL